MAMAEDRRDRLALRLLFKYGLRKGALQHIQFKHFDHQRLPITCFLVASRSRTSETARRSWT
jgi:hypothetical protein